MKTVLQKNGELPRLIQRQEALSELGWTSGDISRPEGRGELSPLNPKHEKA
jgi:hypothetical protein